MNGLTQRQLEVFRFIKRSIKRNGYSPSYEEIRAGLDMGSRARVHQVVHSLVERGAITLLPKRARSIAVKDAS